MKKKTSWAATAVLMGLPLFAAAQADPGASGPALGYQSAFSDYKPWEDIKPADWRAANDAVRDVKPGGAHVGDGAAPIPANPASAAPAAAPAARRQAAPGGHSGHGDHK